MMQTPHEPLAAGHGINPAPPDPSPSPAYELTRVLLLAGGTYGDLIVHPSPVPRDRTPIAYHLPPGGGAYQGTRRDAVAIRIALLGTLVDLGSGRAWCALGDHAEQGRQVVLTDAGRRWLITHRVHGVPVELGRSHRSRPPVSWCGTGWPS